MWHDTLPHRPVTHPLHGRRAGALLRAAHTLAPMVWTLPEHPCPIADSPHLVLPVLSFIRTLQKTDTMEKHIEDGVTCGEVVQDLNMQCIESHHAMSVRGSSMEVCHAAEIGVYIVCWCHTTSSDR